MPKISIVLPVYNMEPFLKATMDSILGQTFTDFELICIDDGSTDQSIAILNNYAATDSRISVYQQQNEGPGVARNTGLQLATGTYVMMLDADDIYHTNMLELLYKRALKCDADIVVCKSSRFDNSTGDTLDSWWMLNEAQLPVADPFSYKDMPDYIFTAFMGWPWDKLYKRSFIEHHNLRYPKLSNSEDLFFVFLSIAKAQKISTVDKVLIKHRDNRSDSVSGSREKDPLAFYTSTCLLKKELKKDSELYQKVYWGFLNWAFGYMLWNIETMDAQEARSKQLKALRTGVFSELEIEGRSPAFFSLEPNAYERYILLLNEATGKQNVTTESFVHRMLVKLIHFLQKLNDEGFKATLKAYTTVIMSMINGIKTVEEEPKLKRGENFMIKTSQKPLQNKGEC